MLFGNNKKKDEKNIPKDSTLENNACAKVDCESLPSFFEINLHYYDSYLEVKQFYENFKYYPVFEIKNREVVGMGFKDVKDRLDDIVAKDICETMSMKDFGEYFALATDQNTDCILYKTKPENLKIYKPKDKIVFVQAFFMYMTGFLKQGIQ